MMEVKVMMIPHPSGQFLVGGSPFIPLSAPLQAALLLLFNGPKLEWRLPELTVALGVGSGKDPEAYLEDQIRPLLLPIPHAGKPLLRYVPKP
jgi:hypothetical protein